MKLLKTISIVLLGTAIVITSCKKKNAKKNISSNNSDYHSYYNKTKSHNMGQDCLSCHKSGGTGETTFTLGGTVYDTTLVNTMPNCTVEFYTAPNGTGTLQKTIEVDGKGNFYTTSSVDFSAGLFPAIRVGGSIRYMSTPTTTGACASCHGVITSKLYAY